MDASSRGGLAVQYGAYTGAIKNRGRWPGEPLVKVGKRRRIGRTIDAKLENWRRSGQVPEINWLRNVRRGQERLHKRFVDSIGNGHKCEKLR